MISRRPTPSFHAPTHTRAGSFCRLWPAHLFWRFVFGRLLGFFFSQ